jgi:GWxTD domain-containing protein
MTESERSPFEDLHLIADPYELRHFEEMVPDEREDFLRAFWRSKDPQPVTPVNEREVEHWRRVVMADLLYALPRYEKRGWETARGELLIRYGEPLYTEYMQGGRALFFSIPGWYHIYAAGGGELEVTFYDMALNGMFYLPFTGLPTPNDLASYEMPQGYIHDYGGRWVTPVMAVGEFRGPRARTRAEVYLAMAADSLASYQGTTVGVGTVVFDPSWKEVVRSEEILELDGATIAGEADRAVVHQINLDLKPGAYIVASEIRGDAGAVVGTTTQEIAVHRFPADSLALSAPEIAFAVDSAGPERFKKGAVHVVPNATGEVRGSEALVVYFEIYHLAPRPADGLAEYVVHYRITPADREGNSIWTRITNAMRSKTFIESSFVEQARGEVVRRNLTIDVSTLAPDRYRLDLEVTDLTTGSTASRATAFRRSSL